MQPPPALTVRRRDPWAWRLGIGCLAVLAFLTSAAASIPFFAWVALAGADPFPTVVLLGFVPAIASVALGVWTWREKRVSALASITAVVGGGLGLAFALGYILLGLLVLRAK